MREQKEKIRVRSPNYHLKNKQYVSVYSHRVSPGECGCCQPAHSAETFLSLPWPFVSLTLSSFARATMVFLYNLTNALRKRKRWWGLVNVPSFGWKALSNLASVDAVVHQEEFDVLFVSDEELLEARLELVSGLLILLAADLRFPNLASEASSHTRVNTSLLSPRSL